LAIVRRPELLLPHELHIHRTQRSRSVEEQLQEGWRQMQQRAKADEAGGGLNDAGCCCTSLQKLGRPAVHAELADCKLVNGMHCGDKPTNKYITDLPSSVQLLCKHCGPGYGEPLAYSLPIPGSRQSHPRH
jgi:hypothetical protein